MSVKRRRKIIVKIGQVTKKELLWKAKTLRLKIPGVSLSRTILEDRRPILKQNNERKRQ